MTGGRASLRERSQRGRRVHGSANARGHARDRENALVFRGNPAGGKGP